MPDTETPISGSLKIIPGKNAELKLVGSFRSVKEIFLGEKSKTEIILGELPTGEKVTLYKCFVTQQQVSTPGFPVESYFVHFVFIGAHFKNSDDITFRTIRANYSYLDSWVNISGFDIQHQLDAGEFIIKYKSPQPIQANINDYKVSIDFEFGGLKMSIVQKDIYLEQKTIIKIDFSDEKSLEECIDVISLIQNFLTLGVGEPVKPIKIKGLTDSNKLTINGKDYKQSIEIMYATQYRSDEQEDIIPQNMVFSFKDVSDNFEDCLRNWVEKAESLEPVYNLYFGTLYNPHMYLEHSFLSLVQALESYHRRVIGSSELPEIEHEKRVNSILESSPHEYKKWLKGLLKYSNEPRLRARLIEILELYPQIRESKRNRDIFFNVVVKIRNHLTHYTNPDDEIIKTVLKDRQQFYDIVQNLKSLMELCFLTELGFDENKITDMRPYKKLMK